MAAKQKEAVETDANPDVLTKGKQADANVLELAKGGPAAPKFREESETSQFLRDGRSPISDIDSFVGALQRDYACGAIDGGDVTAHLAPIKQYLKEIGARGGKATAHNLTKEQLIERARKAAAAREAKKKGR